MGGDPLRAAKGILNGLLAAFAIYALAYLWVRLILG